MRRRAWFWPTTLALVLLSSSSARAGSPADAYTDALEDEDFEDEDDYDFDPNLEPCDGSTCSEPDEHAWFTAPSDGAMVMSPFTVEVEVSHTCWCDTCGCYEEAIDSVQIWANGELVAGPDLGSFELDLAPGEYQLIARPSDAWDLADDSAPITVTVIGEGETGETGGTDESGETGGTETGTTEETGVADEDGGTGSNADEGEEAQSSCACTSNPEQPAPWLGTSFALLLGLAGLRRRRARAS